MGRVLQQGERDIVVTGQNTKHNPQVFAGPERFARWTRAGLQHVVGADKTRMTLLFFVRLISKLVQVDRVFAVSAVETGLVSKKKKPFVDSFGGVLVSAAFVSEQLRKF